MLTNLNVQNFALISDVEIIFGRGMNIITGETGAGKSILIGALGLVLGKRADSSSLRNNQEKCIIEAAFDIENYHLKTIFDKNDLDYDNHTIFRREITPAGKSRSFINDTPVNLKVLQEIGSKLIEIHSQRDNVQLFTTDFQYKSLDLLSGCQNDLEEYTLKFQGFKRDKNLLRQLKEEEEEHQREQDYNQFLFDELKLADLENVDEDAMTQELELLENAEQLIQTYREADHLLQSSDLSILNQLQELMRLLGSHKLSVLKDLERRINSVMIELQDIGLEINNNAHNTQIDPLRLEELNERNNQLFALKNKHRKSSAADLKELFLLLEEKLANSSQLQNRINELENQLSNDERKLNELANTLSEKRNKNLVNVECSINKLLVQMGMEHSMVKYELTHADELNFYGCNQLNVLLSSNKGESFLDIKKAASGGELARINLSFKHILSQYLQMPTSIFDEIDTGVSGEVARKVGSVMKKMAKNQQLIVITHLPQIASMGDYHKYVHKTEKNNLIETQVRNLDGDERIHEIAKMISGDDLTKHAIEQSKMLLN
ncbi:MAG: DNA repair protein RecN [Bacteroidia bacterium]|nr:DNA repair protein RecN [Bacteroidia bacterium]MDG2042694.1 DNA repair protein RecN [Bacteroidia bacterium]|tara:strand:- start:4802 stop:6448 length:1647 start_codon:yes stop_codon:yes gene_type:complete